MAWPVLTTYKEEYLRTIAFPLGGIGTGSVCLGGRGNLCDWEIMNRPSKGFAPDYGFFTLWTKTASGKKDTRIIEKVFSPPFTGERGVSGLYGGVQRFRNVVFNAAYPFCSIDFSDPSVPLKLTLDAFNPFIPLDSEKTGLPIAYLRFILKNPTKERIEASIAGSLQNFIGNDGVTKLETTRKNEYRKENGFSGLFYSGEAKEEMAPQIGTLALITMGESVSHNRHWGNDNWRVGLLEFWDDFSDDGIITDYDSTPERTFNGSIASKTTIEPGETKIIPFLLAWHFPNRTASGCGWQTQPDDKNGLTGNYYTTLYKDAWEVAQRTVPEIPDLERETLTFVKTFCESSLPQSVKEAALNNLSTLRTQNCFRTADGNFFGFEGTNDKEGCCFGSCTHVWNYETSTAFLFPELARSMRRVELQYSTNESGLNSFRTALPLKKICCESKPFGAATDGQMGVIIKLYREWKLSGDDSFLKELWPSAKKALEFSWIKGGWDGDMDGVMEGVQHNTYDVEFYGPNPMMTGWYLTALKCTEEMAIYLGEKDFAKKCQSLYKKGSKWVDENLFNGEYYIQIIQPPKDKNLLPKGLVIGMGAKDMDNPDFQVGKGCLIDQLVGQYMAHISGLGYILDPENVKKTVHSIFKYNFRESLYDHFNDLRTFALNDEAGLLICTWPKGERPRFPIPYFSEIMTGFEYQAAVLMIYEGMNDEAIKVIQSIRNRYDGNRRNPWDEIECGHHYARAMAAWSAIVAFSGFYYDGTKKSISFNPCLNEKDFASFWSAGNAWGFYTQSKTTDSITAKITIKKGPSELRTISIGSGNIKKAHVTVKTGNKTLSASVKTGDGKTTLSFDKPLILNTGTTLEIIINQ